MPHSKRILLAVDKSPASRRAVDYVAEMLGGGAGFHVGLLHLEAPPHMLEWGGSENAQIEDQVSEQRSEEYKQMEKASISEGKAMPERYHALLRQKGVDVTVLLVQFEDPLTREMGGCACQKRPVPSICRWRICGEQVVSVAVQCIRASAKAGRRTSATTSRRSQPGQEHSASTVSRSSAASSRPASSSSHAARSPART
jgi:hypothetical protein